VKYPTIQALSYSSGYQMTSIQTPIPPSPPPRFLKRLLFLLKESFRKPDIQERGSMLFFSYSHKDKVFVQKLYAALSPNYEIWVDWEDIPPAVEWWEEIKRGIEDSDYFLFMLTPNSAISKVCGQELEYALSQGKRIFPIVIEQPDPVPLSLRSINWMFFTPEEDFGVCLTKLLNALNINPEDARLHTKFYGLWRDWVSHDRDRSYLLRGKQLWEATAWLAKSDNSTPLPLQEHREYIWASQLAQFVRIKRITTGIIVSAILGVLITLHFLTPSFCENGSFPF